MDKKAGQAIVIETPVPIRKQVYEHLRNQILNHSIEPSSRLVEGRIAKEMGISRTPIREALHLLERDGFVESIPRVGYRVKKLEWEELNEIFEIRKVNETLVCRWAIERIDNQSLKILEKNTAKTQSALDKGFPELFLDYDEEFHETLARAAGSRHLFELCRQLRRLMLRYRAASIRTSKSLKTAFQGHKKILSCLKKKDSDGLEVALIDHLNYSRDDIRKSAIKELSKGD